MLTNLPILSWVFTFCTSQAFETILVLNLEDFGFTNLEIILLLMQQTPVRLKHFLWITFVSLQD